MPNGGRAVRRHDDGDENERRRCCGHSGHAARTFGAFVRRREEDEEDGEKAKDKGEPGEKNKGERKGEREKGERSETAISDASRRSRTSSGAPGTCTLGHSARITVRNIAHMYLYAFVCGRTLYVRACVCVHVRRIHAPYLRTAAPRTRTRDGSEANARRSTSHGRLDATEAPG